MCADLAACTQGGKTCDILFMCDVKLIYIYIKNSSGEMENARDNQTRKIQENITNVEKHFGEMCQMFAAYVRKTARLRDKADILVREIGTYADTETPNLKSGLKQFADHLAKIEDYRQAEVERLEAKVIEPLKSYGAVVKRKREDLKTTQSARDREAKQMAQLERTRQRNPSDRQIIAESELQRATMDATRTTRQLEETIDEFEKQKIRDIKKIFGEFVTVEMSFHAKALEVYTLAYQSIQSVDEEADLEQQRAGSRQTRREEEEEDDEEDEDESEEEEDDEDEEDSDDEN
ncbi:hypothetical protein L3Q82_014987 [Scortum barcoo]|uniref:Uncharacterized protein n=1 Tax=Scortum barcoo TaxID=214431 RepID=A0ACB8VUH1_9TELE|nr:hypothetical protein L3Q82_014987 [Scortum barcoo]